MNQYPGKLIPQLLLTLCALLGTTTVSAQNAVGDTVYVTDELRLGLYSSETTDGRAIKTLISGSKLEVTERSLMSIRVRTEDGDEGWVKSAYIVKEEPGRRRAERLESEYAELQAAHDIALSELSEAKSRNTELSGELERAEAGIEELPALQERTKALETELSAYEKRVDLHWLLIAALAALVLGFGAGYYWLDHKVRRQFGGVRVY